MQVVGLDSRTTSISGVVLNSETGLVLTTQTRPNTAMLAVLEAFLRLQDPALIVEIAKEVLAQLMRQHPEVTRNWCHGAALAADILQLRLNVQHNMSSIMKNG